MGDTVSCERRIDAGIDPIRIKQAGNWKGISMVECYYGKKKIANKGIVFE